MRTRITTGFPEWVWIPPICGMYCRFQYVILCMMYDTAISMCINIYHTIMCIYIYIYIIQSCVMYIYIYLYIYIYIYSYIIYPIMLYNILFKTRETFLWRAIACFKLRAGLRVFLAQPMEDHWLRLGPRNSLQIFFRGFFHEINNPLLVEHGKKKTFYGYRRNLEIWG